MMSKKAKSGSQKRKEKRQERDRKRNEGKQLLTDFFPKKVSETVTEGDAAATDPSSTDTVDLRQEGSVQVDREDVIEDDGNEGSESREGSEESERDEERSESSQGSAKEYMPLPEDPVLWPEKLTNEERDTIVRRLASKEKTNKITAKDKEGKPFPNYLQFAKSANGREKIKRDWLIYSESAEALYCIPCLLFSHELKKPSRSALNSNDGMKISHMKWQRMYRKLPEHETNMPHKECYLKWKSLQHSLLSGTGVGHIQKQIQTEIEKNRIILERLLDVTLHLASRNLPFRGKTSNLGDVHNGNFLGTLELLAHYDSVLEEHLEKLRQKKEGSRLTHYLSPETQNEFIDICGKRVLNTILAERETAIYYSVICDSTPDISHIFLLTVWVKVLQCIENRNLILQTGDISLDSQAANIKDLQEEIQAICNKWDSLLTEASLVAQAMEIPAQFRSEERRKRKRKLMPDERRSEDETECSAEQAFRNNVFFVAIDSIISDLSERFQTTATLCESFAPLLRLGNMSEEQIKATCRALTRTYPKDLTVEFENEMLLLKTVYNATFAHNLSPLQLLNAIYKLQLQSIFGETCIALRIFCTLPVMVAGGERAFSKMKLVKNYLRSTMSQDRLNSLALLSIESQFSRKLDFKDLIKDFAIKKTRQWALTGV